MSGSRVTLRAAAIAAAAIGAGMALPAACLFPDYTFDLGATGGSGTMSTSTSTSSGSTTTSTSSTGTGGGTSTSSSSTSSSGMACASADCSDPACSNDYACSPALPNGWTGFFALYDGPPAGDPGCTAAFPTSDYLGNAQIMVPPATCSTCSCGSPQNQKCAVTGPASTNPTYPNTMELVDLRDASCGGSPHCGAQLQVPNNWTGACYGPNGISGGETTCGVNAGANCTLGSSACNVAIQVGPVVVSGGTCTATMQMPDVPPVAWGKAGEACGGAMPTGKGCNGTAQCLPKPHAPFETGLCVYMDGDNACPPGQFSEKHLFYTGTNDTRTCSDCSCDAPAGGTCSATITVYSDGTIDTCNTLIATLNPTTAAGDCKNIAGNPQVGSRKAVFSQVTGGNCQATGGQPSGTATPTTPRTYCCIP